MTFSSLPRELLASWATNALPLLNGDGAELDWDGRTSFTTEGLAEESRAEIADSDSAGVWHARPLCVDGEARGRIRIRVRVSPPADLFDAMAGLLAGHLATWSEREALQPKVRHIEQATEAARVGLWEWEPDTGVSRSHGNWPRFFGYAPGEISLSYDGWASLVHPEDLPGVVERLRAFISSPTEDQLRAEYRVRHHDGSWRWALSLANIVGRYADGRVALVAGSHQDVHLEKFRQLAVIESDRYSRELFDSSPDCIKVIGLDGKVIDVSRSAILLLGLKHQCELVGQNWPDFWDEPFRTRARDALLEAGKGRSNRFRGFRPTLESAPRWWDIFVAPLRNAEGTIDRTLVTSRDITDQVEAEDALHNITAHVQAQVVERTAELVESESRLRSILSNLDGMAYRWVHDATREVLFASDGCEALLGVTTDALISANTLLESRIHPDDRRRVASIWTSLDPKAGCEHDYRIVRTDGEVRWIHEGLSVVSQGENASACVDAMLTDITRKREMYRTLTLANHTLEESLIAVFWMDAQGRGLRANRATAELLGYAVDELINLDLSEVHPDFAATRWAKVCRKIRSQGPQQLHVQARHSSGRRIPVLILLTRVHYEGKDIYVGFASDESSRLTAERERRNSELLSRAALGSMSSRIAIMDRHGRILAINRAWGTAAQDGSGAVHPVVGENYLQLLARADHPAAATILDRVHRVLHGDDKTCNMPYLLADSEQPTWMELHLSRFGYGDDVRVVAGHEDISQHKRVQHDLENSRKLFETLCATAPVVIFHTDDEGSCGYISQQWDVLTGRQAEQDLGHGWMRAVHPEDREAFRADWASVRESGENFVTECRLVHVDSREVNAYFQAIRLVESGDHESTTRWVGTITDVTEIDRANRKLAKAEARQRQILEALPALVYALRPTDDDQLVAPAWLSSYTSNFGYTFDGELPPSRWWPDNVHPEDFERVMLAFQTRLAHDDRWSYEYRLRRADGSYAWVADHLHAVRDENGMLVEVIGSLNDVTDRYAAEAAYRESEARLQVAFEQAAVGMAQLTYGRVIRPNRRLLNMLGAEAPEELADAQWATLTHPEDRERDQAMLDNLVDGKNDTGSLDKRLLRRDGRDIWVHVTYSVVANAASLGASIFAVIEDISERRRIQGAANQALSTLDAIAEATFSFAAEHITFFYVNEGAIQQSGFSRSELLGMSLPDIQSPADGERLKQLLDLAIAQPHRVHRLETRLQRRDGTELPVEVALRYISESGEAPYFVAVARDITDRLHAQQRLEDLNAELEGRVAQRTDDLRASNQLLRNKEEQIRAIVENIPGCVVTFDCDGVITGTNAAIQDIFGITVGSAIGHQIGDLVPHLLEDIHGVHDGEVRALAAESRTDSSMLFQGSFIGLGGGNHRIDLEVSVGAYALHGQAHYAAIIRDVRQELDAKRELLRARAAAEQGSQAKSSFLATMSHEIRTPMNAVLGMAELLTHRPLARTDREMVETIQHSAAALLDLLDDLLDFSKIEAGKLELAPHPLEMDRMVEAVCATHMVAAQERQVALQAAVCPNVPEVVHADPVRMRQIMHNLIGNAIKFSSGRSGIEGRVDVRLASQRRADGHLDLTIIVTDNGIGMTEETIARVFSPFTQAEATTTRRFGGTGLGLSICKRLVDLMDGEIRCYSKPGEGTRFEVALTFSPKHWSDSSFSDGGESPGMPMIRHAAVVSPDAFFRDTMVAYLDSLAIPRQTFESIDAAAAWLGHCDGDRTVSGELLIISDIRNPDGWEAIQKVVTAALGCTPLQLAWLRGSSQSPSLVDVGVVVAGRGVLSLPRLLRAARCLAKVRRLEETRGRDDQDSLAMDPDTTLLVAEDHEINQRVILHQLRRLGLRADVVGDGVAALERWRSGRYAMVLADLHMPVMDGYSLARNIRSEEHERRLPRTPIIAFTANAVMGEDARCFEAGMDDVVTKPAKLGRLKAVIRQWLEYRAQIELQEHPEAATEVTLNVDDALVDLAVLRSLVGDEPATLREFLKEFLSGSSRLMDGMRERFGTPHWREGANLAHRLKSSSRSVGACRLGDLSENLETMMRQSETTEAFAKGHFARMDAVWERVADTVRGHMTLMENTSRV